VIVSDSVGVADIVRERRAGQVTSIELGSITDALRRYLEQPEVRQADASRARPAAISDTSFAAHGARLANEYARVLARRTQD
jgi:glycosyltransferase involved in cell wall biosynthesis